MMGRTRSPFGGAWCWEQRLSRRQRAGIVLMLIGVIAAAGFSAWRGWSALARGERVVGGAPDAEARRSYPLPIPEGAQVVLRPGAIPAITRPRFIGVAGAQARDRSPMILVSNGGETHVYSIYLLDGHEIVNDVIGGEPVATTW